jgi:hypothetical protein
MIKYQHTRLIWKGERSRLLCKSTDVLHALLTKSSPCNEHRISLKTQILHCICSASEDRIRKTFDISKDINKAISGISILSL